MAKSTGILLAAGGITFGNEWVHHPSAPNWRIPVATAALAIIFAGIEKIPGGEPFAVGVAVIALAGTLLGGVTPGVPSPAQQILDFMGYGQKGGKK